MTEEGLQPDDSGAAQPVDGTPPVDADGAPAVEAPTDGTVLTDNEGPQGAPESYADFVVPEGMEIDTGLMEQAAPIFKEIGLSQIQGQRLVDMFASHVQADSQANSDSYNQTVKDWVEEAKSDSEIGGQAFDENVGLAKRGIDGFGTPKLVEVLNQTGLGNHPEFIRLFTRIGKTLKEDDPGAVGGATGGDQTGAQILYPDLDKSA